MIERLRKIPTMKRWGIISWAVTITLSAILVYGIFRTDCDMSYLVPVVSLAWGEIATYHAVYAYKEKAANKLKISYDFIEKMADKYGIETVTPVLQCIISD